MINPTVLSLVPGRMQWAQRAQLQAQHPARWLLVSLKQRQSLDFPLYAPAAVLLVLEGEVQVQRGVLQGTLHAGQGLMLEESGAGTHVQLGGTGSAHALWIGFSGSDQRHGGMDQISQWLPELPEPARELFNAVRNTEAGRAPLAQLLQQLQVDLRARSQLMSGLLDRCPGRSRRHREDVLMRLQRVKALLDIPRGPVQDLGTLAQTANYSLSHFQRMFTRVYALSPIEHQRQSRLARARELIALQRLSVREVAESVGFDSRSTFNRLFRERFGDSAGRVREARFG